MTFGNQSFYLLFQGMTLFNIMIVVVVKMNYWGSLCLCDILQYHDCGRGENELLGFLVFISLFIGCGYCMKYFLFIVANTSTCVVVKGVVRSLEKVMWLGIDPLVFLLDALVRDWLYWRDFSLCRCKWGCSYLVTFFFY